MLITLFAPEVQITAKVVNIVIENRQEHETVSEIMYQPDARYVFKNYVALPDDAAHVFARKQKGPRTVNKELAEFHSRQAKQKTTNPRSIYWHRIRSRCWTKTQCAIEIQAVIIIAVLAIV